MRQRWPRRDIADRPDMADRRSELFVHFEVTRCVRNNSDGLKPNS